MTIYAYKNYKYDYNIINTIIELDLFHEDVSTLKLMKSVKLPFIIYKQWHRIIVQCTYELH